MSYTIEQRPITEEELQVWRGIVPTAHDRAYWLVYRGYDIIIIGLFGGVACMIPAYLIFVLITHMPFDACLQSPFVFTPGIIGAVVTMYYFTRWLRAMREAFPPVNTPQPDTVEIIHCDATDVVQVIGSDENTMDGYIYQIADDRVALVSDLDIYSGYTDEKLFPCQSFDIINIPGPDGRPIVLLKPIGPLMTPSGTRILNNEIEFLPQETMILKVTLDHLGDLLARKSY